MNWRRFFERDRRDQDLAREMESYLAHETDDNLKRGMDPGTANDEARRKLGNLAQVREQVYEHNSVPLVENAWQDLKYGFRQLKLRPGFALTAIVSLALGIGANTAIFTLVDQVLVRMLPVRNPQELVQLRVEGGRYGNNSGDTEHTFSYPAYQALRNANTVFSGLAGSRVEQASLTIGERAESVNVALVSGNYFRVLGIQPHLGRVFTGADDTARMRHPLAVLQYGFWRSRFAGNPSIVGASITLNGHPFTVIGVGAPDYEGTDVGVATQIWVPVTMKPVITPTWDGLNDERLTWFYLFARLKPGVTVGQAQAAMRVLYRQRQHEELKSAFFQKFPEMRDRFLRQSFSLSPAARGQSGLRHGFERPLIILQALVGVVLLIACMNVANLLLARAAARRREIAIRGALGATRGRLVRQFLAESTLIAIAGGILGLLASSWAVKVLLRLLPEDPANFSLSTSPDSRILLFTASITVFTALFFGVVSAFHGSRTAPAASLKEDAANSTGSHGHVRLRKLFVAVQVGLSCVLLVGAGLFARTLQNLKKVELGFNTENVVTFTVRPATVYDHGRKLRTYRSLVESLSAMPGVKAVGASRQRLLSGGRWDSSMTIPGVEAKQGGQLWSYFNAVTPGYFQALGIPIKHGRDVGWNDWGSGRRVCLVNEALVNEYLDGASPLGRMIAEGSKNDPNLEIVGVFGNARYDGVRDSIPRQVFVSMDTKIGNIGGVHVYARVLGDPRPMMPRLREQVRGTDSNLVISNMRTLDDQLNMRLANERLLSFLSVAFALLAIVLAMVGLYGVLAFVVERRTRELGIRMALGAGRGAVIGLAMWEMLPVILVGIAVGAAAGLFGGRYIESQLYGLKANDLAVLLMSTAALLIVSASATFVPAWRASRIDPIQALRHE